MSVISLVNQAVAWYAVSAVLAFLFALHKPLSGAIAGIGGAVASAIGLRIFLIDCIFIFLSDIFILKLKNELSSAYCVHYLAFEPCAFEHAVFAL